MKTRLTILLVLALAALALAACAPAAQTEPTTQIPPAQSEPTTAPAAEEPTVDANTNPLISTNWNLSALDGAAPASESPANLEFLDDGRIAGTTGCNRYFGPFTVAGDTLTTGALGSTMMACPEPLMAQEQTFLAILGSAASYTIADDTLTIIATDGRSMTFTRA